MLHEYDRRDLQRKALERWEKQQETWSKIEQRLQTQRLFSRSHDAHNNNSCTPNMQEHHQEYSESRRKALLQRQEIKQKDQSYHTKHMMSTTNNKTTSPSTMLHAPTEDRKKREANQIFYMAHNSTNSTGNCAWEDTLRRSSNDVSSMRRSVPIGKITYPYALYPQISNNNGDVSAVRQTDLTFTRIIHSDEVSNSEVENKIDKNNNKNVNSEIITKCNYGNTFPQPNSRTSRVREKLHEQLTSNYVADEEKDIQRKAESYIAQHANSLVPSVKKQISYLTGPRHFLQVVGHATPVKVNTSERIIDTAEQSKHNNLKKQQEHEQQQQQQLQTAVQPQMEWMQSVPLETHLLPLHKNEQNTLNDIDSNQYTSADVTTECANVNNNNSNNNNNMPFLNLSSRRLTFYAKPLELVHQTLEIENTSSVTVYYTMTPIDTWQEFIEEEQEEEVKVKQEKQKEQLTDTEMENEEMEKQKQQRQEVQNMDNIMVSELPCEHVVTGTLHTLAKHHAQCVNYFYLSNESNGVIYPMSSVQFAFSLRSPRAGRFRQTYELLTVPASSTRILIELIGLVQHGERPECVSTSPIHKTLEHKAVVNEQRQIVRGAMNAHDPYEAAELESAIMAIHTAEEEKENARRAVIAQHRQQWDETNAFNLCDIPFNCEVYDAFNALHQHVCVTLEDLSCPLPCKSWNGSIRELIGLLSMLRDNALRELLYDGVMVLLRASRVSLDENEPLQLLLHRAAVVCVLEEERHGVLAHSNHILDWQAQCEDEVLRKLEVLHNDESTTTGQVNMSYGNNNNSNTRKSRSVSPPSVSAIKNNSKIKSTRGNVNTNVSDRNANRNEIVSQITKASTSSWMTHKNSKGKKSNEAVSYLNNQEHDKSVDESNINVSLIDNVTDDVVNSSNVLGMKQEYETLMKEYVIQQVQTRECKVHNLLSRYRSLVEVCCSLPLLHVVHAARADTIARIQSAMEIEVDISNPAFAASSMIGTSGNGNALLADSMNTKGNANNNSNNSNARTSKRR